MLIKTIGFILLFGIFVFSLYEKITKFDSVKDLTLKKIDFLPSLAPYVAIVLLCLGTTTVFGNYFGLLNNKIGKFGIDTLILFTSLATYFFHNISKDPTQRFYFEKNIAIIGGMLLYRSYL